MLNVQNKFYCTYFKNKTQNFGRKNTLGPYFYVRNRTLLVILV